MRRMKLGDHALKLMMMMMMMMFLVDRAAHNKIGYWHDIVVCPPSVRLSVTLCSVAKQYILQQKCTNKEVPLETRRYNFQPPTGLQRA